MANKYYIADNAGLYGEKLVNMKKNNYYIYRALTNIYKSVEQNDPKVGGPFRAPLLAGESYKSDSEMGFNTNNLTKKLKFLVISLSDVGNVRKFKKSLLYLEVLEPMSCGTQVEVAEQWLNFNKTAACEPAFKDKSSLDAALICQRDDINAPLGLNFSELINTFVKTAGYERYYLEDCCTVEEEIAISEAVAAQLKAFKSHKRFKASFFNPEI